jgi:catechol 2,3-dioxygenase
MNGPFMVGHVHLKVRDPERVTTFYTDVLGVEVTETQGRYRFFSWGDRHHDVAVQEVGSDAPGPSQGVGLYHAAFEVDTGEALAGIYERVQDRDVEVSSVDHGLSKALYFSDPDGNGVEVYLDTREETNRSRWKGQNDPFDPSELG